MFLGEMQEEEETIHARVHAAAQRAKVALEDASNHKEEERKEEVVSPSPEDEVAVVLKALMEAPIFKGCEENLMEDLATRAATNSQRLQAHEELSLTDNTRLYVILSGALQVCVALGPSIPLGEGSILGMVGFLGLHQKCEQFKPGNYRQDSPIFKLTENERRNSVHIETETVNVYNVCPRASPNLSGTKDSTPSHVSSSKLPGWMRFEVKDAGLEVSAKVASLALSDVLEVFDATDSLTDFLENRERLLSNFFVILKHAAFPGVAPEVIWAIAEQTEGLTYQAGEKIVTEGEVEMEKEALMIVEKGKPQVEKFIFQGGKEAVKLTIGQLSAGAVIGDICFLQSQVPHACTVIATGEVKVVRIPAVALLLVLGKFPGICACENHRLKDYTSQLEASLLRPSDVLAGLRMFSNCSLGFIRAIASICERRLYHCGDIVKDEGSTDNILRIQEFGTLLVEKNGIGVVNKTAAGTIVGERMFFGRESHAKARFRAATPLVIMLCIPQHAFATILRAHPLDSQNFRHEHDTDGGKSDIGNAIMKLAMFQDCGSSFLRKMSGCIYERIFKPGQTITIQGHADDGSMYLLKTGQAGIFVQGNHICNVGGGASFGELALLGLVRRRAATVRAVSLCFTWEIQRTAFLAALNQHTEERERFGHLTTQHGSKVSNVAKWPMLIDGPKELMYLVNLYAQRQITKQGEWTSRNGDPLPLDAAVLILHGDISLVSYTGETISTFHEGTCFGEQILLGMPAAQGRLVPQTSCEIQLLTKEVVERIFMEYPGHREWFLSRIRSEMASKAEQKLGFLPGNPGILRLSAIFRMASDKFIKRVHGKLDTQLVNPGETLIRHGQDGDTFFILVQGTAILEGDANTNTLEAPSVLGESVLLGLASYHSITVRTASFCLVRSLTRSLFLQLLDDQDERRIYEQTAADHGSAQMPLRERLARKPLFSNSSIDFLNMMSLHANDVFYAPGEILMKRGEHCELGKTSMYVLLAGQALVQNEVGELLARLRPGDILGEGGSLGLTKQCVATVVAGPDALLHCIRVEAASIIKAVHAHSDQYEAMRKIFLNRKVANAEFEQKRKHWIQDCVVPGLMNSRLFEGFPQSLLFSIANALVHSTYLAGQDIMEVGEDADSLVLIVSGEAEVRSKNGDIVGRYFDGAVVGEVAVLGLFPFRTCTLRAVKETQVVAIPYSLILKALTEASLGSLKTNLENLRQERRFQVGEGLPLCSLPLGTTPSDVCVRSVALHADRFVLDPGFVFQPLPKSHPCGKHFAVLTKGCANLVMGNVCLGEARVVAALRPGERGLIPEELVAEFGASIVAVSHCEIYQFRYTDLLLACFSIQAEWFKNFKTFQKEVRELLLPRLISCRAVLQMPKGPNRSIGVTQMSQSQSEPTFQRTLEDQKSFLPTSGSKNLPPLQTTSQGLWSPGGEKIRRSLASCYGSPSPLRKKKPHDEGKAWPAIPASSLSTFPIYESSRPRPSSLAALRKQASRFTGFKTLSQSHVSLPPT